MVVILPKFLQGLSISRLNILNWRHMSLKKQAKKAKLMQGNIDIPLFQCTPVLFSGRGPETVTQLQHSTGQSDSNTETGIETETQ